MEDECLKSGATEVALQVNPEGGLLAEASAVFSCPAAAAAATCVFSRAHDLDSKAAQSL